MIHAADIEPILKRAQGGFAHVYKATSSTPIPLGSPYATTTHVLKRIAVPDKAGVEQVGKEVEVMVRDPIEIEMNLFRQLILSLCTYFVDRKHYEIIPRLSTLSRHPSLKFRHQKGIVNRTRYLS